MAARYPQPIFLDTTVGSNFASTDGIGFLASVLQDPVVVPAVRTEIERGVDDGHDYLVAALESLDETLAVREVSTVQTATAVHDRLDAGEADTILGAREHGGTVATDDLAARRVADGRDLPVTGSIGLLVVGVEREEIDRETADGWLDIWRRRRGYYSPVESITVLLEDVD